MRSVASVSRRALHGVIAALALGLAWPSAGSIGDASGERSALPPGARLRVAVEEDNDAMSIAPHRTDDLYTQGARISARWAVSGGGPDTFREMGVVLGQEIYTPTDANQNTTDLSVLRHDRPYAGWLYAALLLRSEDPAPFALRLGADRAGTGERTTEIVAAVGVTGRPSAAADFQNGFHALVRRWSGNSRSPLSPAGWSVYQTAAAATLDTSMRMRLDLVQASALVGNVTEQTGSVLAARLSPRARLDVGSTIDAASLGLELRAGLLAPRWRGRPASLPVELWGFARADGRYVFHNAFIEGPLRNAVTPLIAVEPWVANLAVGVVARVGPVELGFAQLWLTREFTPSPPGARGMHEVGQVTVAWTTP